MRFQDTTTCVGCMWWAVTLRNPSFSKRQLKLQARYAFRSSCARYTWQVNVNCRVRARWMNDKRMSHAVHDFTMHAHCIFRKNVYAVHVIWCIILLIYFPSQCTFMVHLLVCMCTLSTSYWWTAWTVNTIHLNHIRRPTLHPCLEFFSTYFLLCKRKGK